MRKYEIVATLYAAPSDYGYERDNTSIVYKSGDHFEHGDDRLCFYRDILNVFSAIQYNGSNAERVIKFIGEERIISESGLKMPLHVYSGKKGVQKIEIELNTGDWIIKEAFSNTYILCEDEEFNRKYKKIN